MQNLKRVFVLGFLVLMGIAANAQEADVKKAAENFVKAADNQDPEMLESVLYQDAMQFVMFGPRVMKSTAAEYIAQIRDKKLGGKPREITYENVTLEGENVASVKLRAIGGGLTFAYHLTMFKLEDSWKVMTITTKASQTL